MYPWIEHSCRQNTNKTQKNWETEKQDCSSTRMPLLASQSLWQNKSTYIKYRFAVIGGQDLHIRYRDDRTMTTLPFSRTESRQPFCHCVYVGKLTFPSYLLVTKLRAQMQICSRLIIVIHNLKIASKFKASYYIPKDLYLSENWISSNHNSGAFWLWNKSVLPPPLQYAFFLIKWN